MKWRPVQSKASGTRWKLYSVLCLGSQDHPRAAWCTRRTHRTQKSYYTHSYSLLKEKIQIKTRRGKKHMRWCPGNPGVRFHITSPSRETQMHFILPGSVANQGKLTWAVVFRSFSAGQKQSHTVSGWPASAIQTPAPQKQKIDIRKESHTLSDETDTMWPLASACKKVLVKWNILRAQSSSPWSQAKDSPKDRSFLEMCKAWAARPALLALSCPNTFMIIKQIVKKL